MDKLDNITGEFVRDVKEAAGSSLRSAILYGSALTDEFIAGRSDYNFIVVVNETTPALLNRLSPCAKRWHKRAISTPLVVDPAFLPTAVDSYPIEILAMKARYRVLEGDDVLASLSPDPKDVRLQCERELRSKLLHLRRGYIDAGGNAGDLLRILQRGHSSFIAIFRGMLYMKGGPWDSYGAAFDRACAESLGLSTSLLTRLRAQRASKKPSSAEQLKSDYAELLAAIERLTLETDHWA